MTQSRYSIWAFISLAFLVGCGTTDDPNNYQPSSASPETGLVCLYRTAPRSTSGAWQDWVLDGRWTGEIRPDKYYCERIHVGRHIVRVSVSDAAVAFSLEKDQKVFVRFEVDGSQKGQPFPIYPILVDRDTARSEMRAKGYDIDRAGGSQ